MPRINRRHLLKLSGAGAVAATTGGLTGILATGRAPAFAQGKTLHWLKFVDFVPVSDQLLKGKIKEDCQKALGINLNVETINGDGVQARITSAIQSKNGPDILMAVSNWAQLYADSLIDVSDIAEERGRPRVATSRPRKLSRMTASAGSPCPTRSSACCWSIAPRGSGRRASPRTISRRLGRSTARSARR
jgi:hypothetical protein